MKNLSLVLALVLVFFTNSIYAVPAELPDQNESDREDSPSPASRSAEPPHVPRQNARRLIPQAPANSPSPISLGPSLASLLQSPPPLPEFFADFPPAPANFDQEGEAFNADLPHDAGLGGQISLNREQSSI